jgi:CubicO group peptidase (beta-lactamase class C family)
MKLYEEGKINLDKTIGDYLTWVKGTNKEYLKIRDLLHHQAGLKSWIPFYKETIDSISGAFKKNLYSDKPSTNYTTQVAKNLYLTKNYKDTIWNTILNSPLENTGKYVYSDLDYYFLASIVEHVAHTTIDKYVEEQFYKPMGLKRITYNPLKKFDTKDIAPTENDLVFRRQLLHGYVHDQGAALLGGVAGHAGIFATARDVAAVFQMLLNNGMYKGKRYFKKETVTYFTAYSSVISRRGLGFDKPVADEKDAGPTSNRCSGYTFGHQGFTGTCAWADPATGIVFVFLSNRVCPSAENNAINRMNIRTTVQDYIYEAVGYPANHNRQAVYKKQLREQK